MAEKEKFSISKFFEGFASPTGWAKEIKTIISIALIALIAYMVWCTFFRKTPQNVNKQTVIAQKGSTVGEIHQESIQVIVQEKTWELGVGAGGITYDSKSGLFVGGWIKKKF